MVYICNKCGAVFDDEEIIRTEMEADTGYFECYCPKCGCEHYEDAKQCVVCGEWQGKNLCDDCREELEANLEAVRIKMGATKDGFEEAIAEFFGW